MSVSGPVIDVFINSVVKAGRGIKRGADVCSCRPDYGVEWMVEKHAEFVCMGSAARVTGGLQRARVVAGEVGWGVMT